MGGRFISFISSMMAALYFASGTGSAGADSQLPTGEEILRRSRKGLEFSERCAPGQRIEIAAMGDVLLHDALQIQAVGDPDRFISLWREVRDLIGGVDLAYANLEGTTSWGINRDDRKVRDPGFVFDDSVYSGLPRVNYHPFLTEDLVASGFDIVSTANNHSLDRGPLGLERTIDALEAAGLPFAGTWRRSEENPDRYVVTKARGVKVAWISCTYGLNYVRQHPDVYGQVLHCFEHENLIEKLIRRITRERLADAVIVVPHWGYQFTYPPAGEQIRTGRRFLEAGAIAILGAHPHYVQPWEKIITRDGRETFVIYSLGNFVSGHKQLPRRATVILGLGLTRTPQGKVVINGVRYTPLIMSRDNGLLTVQALDRHPKRESSKEVHEARALLEGVLGTKNQVRSNDFPTPESGCGGSR